MSVYIYHRGLLQKFREVIEKVYFTSPELLIKTAADKSQSGTSPIYPLVSLWCSKWTLASNQNHAAVFRGANRIRQSSDPLTPQYSQIHDLKQLELDLTYQLDIYSPKLQTTLQVVSEFIWLVTDFPNFQISTDADPKFVDRTPSLAITDVNDSIDQTSFVDTGVLYRSTIDLEVQGAKLFNLVPEPGLVEEVQFNIEAFPLLS